MKRYLVLFSFLLGWSIGYAESVQIHHIGVGQGDATLIIITNDSKEVASILIDAGNSTGKGAMVASVIKSYPELASKKQLDLIITSHLHSDHLGGIATVMENLLSDGWKLGIVVDRAGTFVAGADSVCYDSNDEDHDATNDPVEPIPTSALVTKYNAYANALLSGSLIIGRYNVHVGVDLVSVFIKGFACKTSLVSLTGNGLACNKANGIYCEDWQDSRGSVHNENDYSYAFLLQTGSFKYFTGGDIGGESPYVDLETPLLSYFQTRPDAAKFHFCGYKASHHGSEHSTNTNFINYTKPTISVVPSALRSFSGTKLPSQNTLARIANSSTNSNIFYTYVYATNPYSGTVTNFMDVILALDDSAFEQNRNISVITFQRNKGTLLPIGGTQQITNIVCNKH